MNGKIESAVLWVISLLLVGIGVVCLYKLFIVNGVVSFILGILVNPSTLNKMSDKFGENNIYFTKLVILSVFGLVATFCIAYAFCYDFYIIIEDWVSLIKIFAFIIYLVILLWYKKDNKKEKYIVFGTVYCVCVILSYGTDNILKDILSFLNLLTLPLKEKIDIESFRFMIDNIFLPIRESMLAFIIFDTIFNNNNKHKKELSNQNSEPVVEYNINVIEEDKFSGKEYFVKVIKK